MSNAEEERSFFFGCDYEFHSEEVRTIHERLDEALKKADLLATDRYLEDAHVWIITYYDEASADQIYETFHSIASQVIAAEEERLEEEYQNEGIDEDGYQNAVTASKSIQLPVLKPKPTENGHGIEILTQEYRDSSAYDANLTWECRAGKGRMHFIVPLQTQNQIATLTSCRLMQDLNKQRIYISSRFQKDCQKALQKLDTILHRFCHLDEPVVQHVFYSEDSRSYQLSVRSLVNVKPQLVKNTLIKKEDLPPGYGKMHKASVLRYCSVDVYRSIYVLIGGKEIVPLPNLEIMDGIIAPCGVCPAKGETSSNPMLKPPTTEGRELLREQAMETKGHWMGIENWIKDLPKDAAETEEQLMQDTLSRRVPRQTSDKLAPEEGQQMDVFGMLTPGPCMPKSKGERASGPFGTAGWHLNPSAALFHPQEPLAEIAKCQNLIEISSSEPDLLNSDAQGPFDSNFELEMFLNPGGNSKSLLDTENSNANFLDSQALVPTKETVVPADDDKKEAIFARLQGLQGLSEVDSRRYQNTMKQKAPRGREQAYGVSVGQSKDKKQHLHQNRLRAKSEEREEFSTAPDLNARFVKEIETAIRPLIQNMRYWEGDMRLEAQLGRILIRNAGARFTPGSTLPSCWDPEEVRSALTSGFDYSNTVVNMTKMITTTLPEARHILSMTNSSGVQLWQHNATGSDSPQHRMTYEFKCQLTSSEDIFVVKIDADNFEMKIKSAPLEIGVVNVHCISRNWDYRVVAEVEQDLQEVYGHICEAISKSLFIPADVPKPDLAFELPQRLDIFFRAIRLIRESQYLSTDTKSILTLKEIHDLRFNCHEISETETKVFHAWESQAKDAPGEEPVWLEVSITSNKGAQIFEHMQAKEFGDLAEWPEDELLDEGVLQDIYVPACAMVRQMDNIGALNDNGWRPEPKGKTASTAAPVAVAQPPQKWEAGYW